MFILYGDIIMCNNDYRVEANQIILKYVRKSAERNFGPNEDSLAEKPSYLINEVGRENRSSVG